tara:strand:- start:6889 stop:7794 length:906 start_codon:yes stop_codon:yes gene_type:complete
MLHYHDKMISKKKIFFHKDSTFIKISGNDHESFIQGLITNDIYLLSNTACLYSALLTPQGKFLFDFFVCKIKDGVLLECSNKDCDALYSKLKMYKLRSNVLIERVQELKSFLLSKDDKEEIETNYKDLKIHIFDDPRSKFFALKMFSKYDDFTKIKKELNFCQLNFEEYNSLRLENSIPVSHKDLIPNKSFLLEMRFDELNGISWDKGCYMGQELTARTKYRGKQKKKLYGIRVVTNNIRDKKIFFEGIEVGEIRSFCKDYGIALLRKEEAEKCITNNLNMKIGDCTIKPFIPKWSKIGSQ